MSPRCDFQSEQRAGGKIRQPVRLRDRIARANKTENKPNEKQKQMK
jgi:hypothetical protein